MQILKEAPIHKAAGPLQITNEMLKHLDQNSIQLLTKIFNACIELESIPNRWKHSNIYPISKKPKFTGQLEYTRLITLIEHTRKIFTKLQNF